MRVATAQGSPHSGQGVGGSATVRVATTPDLGGPGSTVGSPDDEVIL
ncbi:MAG: hypothetical protein OEO20_10180 [Gemmatimonadota bacterium]|nr:hypothetical protein [Gemmatimonadota bacterium]MDH3478661.1 hypothetical protein [Gemmatimonadota bacterium]MDH3571002.1 hypothetical protein [Gemmatimonadota bacterium]MDH5550504.1 hypothetical protein [Gemmatimonadota bacterium]